MHLDARKRDDARLARDLRAADPLVRDAATLALVARRNRAAIPALVERLRGDDPLEVRRAIGGLVELQAREAVPELIEISRGKDPGFLRELVYALGAIGGDEAQAYLYTMSQGHDQPAVRDAARQALEEMNRHGRRAPGPAPAERGPLPAESHAVTVRPLGGAHARAARVRPRGAAPAAAPTSRRGSRRRGCRSRPATSRSRWGTTGRTRRRTWASARRARWSWWRSGTAATSTGTAGRSASTARGSGTRSATCSATRSPRAPPGPAWWPRARRSTTGSLSVARALRGSGRALPRLRGGGEPRHRRPDDARPGAGEPGHLRRRGGHRPGPDRARRRGRRTRPHGRAACSPPSRCVARPLTPWTPGWLGIRRRAPDSPWVPPIARTRRTPSWCWRCSSSRGRTSPRARRSPESWGCRGPPSGRWSTRSGTAATPSRPCPRVGTVWSGCRTGSPRWRSSRSWRPQDLGRTVHAFDSIGQHQRARVPPGGGGRRARRAGGRRDPDRGPGPARAELGLAAGEEPLRLPGAPPGAAAPACPRAHPARRGGRRRGAPRRGRGGEHQVAQRPPGRRQEDRRASSPSCRPSRTGCTSWCSASA